jgi:hypothetical protein
MANLNHREHANLHIRNSGARRLAFLPNLSEHELDIDSFRAYQEMSYSMLDPRDEHKIQVRLSVLQI